MAIVGVDIWNQALANLGISAFATTTADTTVEATVCARFWEITMRSALAEYPWPFASKREALSLKANGSSEAWGYCYTYPTDCVVVRRIWPGTRTVVPGAEIPFDLELVDDIVGGVAAHTLAIVTDQADAVAEYTYLADVVANYPPDFIEALAWGLSSRIVMPLANDPQRAMAVMQRYEYHLAKAKAAALREGREDVKPDCEFITSRS